MENAIEVKNLTKDYGHGRGIFNFSFNVKKGEVYGIVGTNGSGKTTTIRHMMGFIKPDIGRVKISGLDALRDSAKIKKLVGYIPGQIDFPDVGSGTSFLKIQADLLGIKDFSYMNELIDRFKIDITAPLKRMSKGMKQKMAIVAAFMAERDIYLLDEPSTGLDPLMRDTLIELILEKKRQGKTVFLSSHVFKELEDTCSSVMFIRDGHIVNITHRSEYDNNPRETYTFVLLSEVDYIHCRSELADFMKIYKSADIKCYRRHNHRSFTINIPTELLNQLFRLFSKYTVTALTSEPFTLEKYYTTIIENMEENNND